MHPPSRMMITYRALSLCAAAVSCFSLTMLPVGTARAQALDAPFPPFVDLAQLDGVTGFRILLPRTETFGFHNAISGAGDLNGDGIDDLIFGGNVITGRRGLVAVLYGSREPFPEELQITTLLPQNGGDGTRGFIVRNGSQEDRLGSSVAGLGDINGDGLDDVIIGAETGGRPPVEFGGVAYLLLGRSDGFPAVIQVQDYFGPNGVDGGGTIFIGTGNLGSSVASAGDVNGDGLPDFLLGALSAGPRGSGEGYLFYGSTEPLPRVVIAASLAPEVGGDGSTGVVIRGEQRLDEAGQSVSSAGDLNRDGFGDFIVTSKRWPFDPDGPQQPCPTGAVYVLYGSDALPALIRVSDLIAENGGDGSDGFIVRPVNCGDDIGDDADGVGDFNGDGWPDIVFGAYDPEEAHLFYGKPEGFPPEINIDAVNMSDGEVGFTMKGRNSDHTGTSVAGVGDVNADGRDDMLIGAKQLVDGPENNGFGGAWLLYGTDVPYPPLFTMDDLRPENGGDGSMGAVFVDSSDTAFQVGTDVATIGDVNGDGINDFALAGTRRNDPSNDDNNNIMYVIFGRHDGGGR